MEKNRGFLKVEAVGEREIVMTRVFAAPRPRVFEALTRPELVRRWLGIFGGWTMDVCDVDLRVGGAYRYHWRNTDGRVMGMRGVYREIVAPERIVCTESFDEPWTIGEAVDTMVLAEQGGKTTLTVTVLAPSREARDQVLKSGMEHGAAASYDRLAELLAASPAEAGP